MRILIAVHHFPPLYTGGAEQRAYRTAAALQARGHTVRTIAIEQIDAGPANGVEYHDEFYEGVQIRRVSMNVSAAPAPFQWEYDNPWLGDHVRELIASWKPNIFHLISGYLMTASVLRAARAQGVPSVVTLTDFWWLCPRIQMLRSDSTLSTLPIDPNRCARCLGEEKRRYRLLTRLAPGVSRAFWGLHTGHTARLAQRQHILRQTLNQSSAIISPSRFLRDFHVAAGIDSERIVFSRQGRDFPNLSLEMLEKSPANQLRVGYFGQIVHLKGVHVLVEAVSRLRQRALTLKIYGDPSPYPRYAAALRRQANRVADRVEFCGVCGPSQLSEVLRNVDVIVVPSLWYENSPNVVLEAFAHRTPVIASNLGGMAELVQHGQNGLLFNPGEAASLAEQIERLLDEEHLLDKLRTGIAPIKGASQEIDELVALYRRVDRSVTA